MLCQGAKVLSDLEAALAALWLRQQRTAPLLDLGLDDLGLEPEEPHAERRDGPAGPSGAGDAPPGGALNDSLSRMVFQGFLASRLTSSARKHGLSPLLLDAIKRSWVTQAQVASTVR